jgi:16S rRNA (guanine(966)-N(2))-methyltransferase RsmD
MSPRKQEKRKMPRVVSGTARGTILETVKGQKTRPTADKVKEAVFSSLSTRLYGARFLDLFSGTGQIGIEALSRGAESAAFIDQSKDGIRCITKNLQKTHFEEKAAVIMADAHAGILRLKEGRPFDLVYMDPPYDEAISYFHMAASLLLKQQLLTDGAVVLLEHRATDIPDAFVMNLKLKRSCKYGTIMVSFYERVTQ